MPEFPDALHHVLRFIHIAIGGVGLALFWVPVFARKGGPLHIFCGRLFVWAAYCVGTTALVSSAWGIVDPRGFIGQRARDMDSASFAGVSENFRFIFAILGFLSIIVLNGTYYGVRVVKTRRRHEDLRTPLVLTLQAAAGLAAAALALFGAAHLAASYTGRSSLPPDQVAKYWVPTILGIVSVIPAVGSLNYILRPRPTPMAWWYVHMSEMLGVGIGFHTAFLVFGVQRFVSIQVEGAWRLVPWVLPTLVGVPAISLWVAYYKRKFGETAGAGGPKPTAPMPQPIEAP
jgi:hypothetical protein